MSAISIQTKKFSQLSEILSAPNDGLILIHDGNGVKTIQVENFKADLKTLIDANTAKIAALNAQGAGAHNSIYRGKSLGTSYTTAQQAAVAAGTFDDMYIGDYWTIGSKVYRIAAFDYFYNAGDTACATHHIIVVPDANMYTAKMEETNITTNGYAGSKMRTTNLADALSTAQSAFGAGHILTYRDYLTNASTNGRPSAGSWYDCKVELMNENMVYGAGMFKPVSDGSNVPANHTVAKTQLPLFAFRPDLICNRATWWLRDVVTASRFALVYDSGFANYYNASNALGVRPAIPVS